MGDETVSTDLEISTISAEERLSDRKLQRASHFATIAASIAAVLALGFGASQLGEAADSTKASERLQREMAANQSWERYMELSGEKAKFARGINHTEYAALSNEDRAAYLWYVERALFASEQILSYDPDDAEWKLAIKESARTHEAYLSSKDFLDESICTYSVALRNTLIDSFTTTSRGTYDILKKRNDECLKSGFGE